MFNTVSISHMLRIPTVLVDCAAALITATAMGYYSSVLEPHIREVSYNTMFSKRLHGIFFY